MSTKVCSRHSRENDLKKSLTGKIYLRPGAVPSLFSWTLTLPRKRKAPTPREFGVGSSSRISPEKGPNEENVMDVSDYESFNVETTQLQGVEGDVNLNTSLAHEHLHKTPSKKTPQKDNHLDDSQERRIHQLMCRIRQGFREEHLGHLFQMSTSTVSRIFITWINFMFLKLGQVNIWPSREVIDKTMPEDFKKKYSSTRVIIDCTEVRCQMPSSLHLNGELFSNYKHHTTLKGLIGISPGGAITFISQLYTGSISDREIVVRSGLLDLPLNENDSIMADKGFTIQDLLPLGVSLNIPPFLGSASQMPAEDVILTQEIASLHIC